MPGSAETRLSPAEWASLALLCERPAHGFAIARALAPEGDVGRVWTCSRPLVYRALAVLGERGLVEEQGSEPGASGPPRKVLGATRAGRRACGRWLGEPVPHVRDVRAGLMLKLLFLSRRGDDPGPLLARQRDALLPVVEGLAEAAQGAEGFDRALYLWRLESARAALRFVEEISSWEPGASRSP
ncbi:MAG TPA: PadR family transcriptional regulator [Gaiellaceae bacterium]|nr:PadR family transcriptional regulator [Gaiellaceae bacterium]